MGVLEDPRTRLTEFVLFFKVPIWEKIWKHVQLLRKNIKKQPNHIVIQIWNVRKILSSFYF